MDIMSKSRGIINFKEKLKSILNKSKTYEEFETKMDELREQIEGDYYEDTKLDMMGDIEEAGMAKLFKMPKI